MSGLEVSGFGTRDFRLTGFKQIDGNNTKSRLYNEQLNELESARAEKQINNRVDLNKQYAPQKKKKNNSFEFFNAKIVTDTSTKKKPNSVCVH